LKNYLQSVDYALWVITIVFQCWLFAAALKMKIYRQLFWFVVFLGFESCWSLLLFYVSQRLSNQAYVYSYCLGLAIEAIIIALLTNNFFRVAFAPLNRLPRWTVLKLVVAISFVITAGICLAFYKPAISHSGFAWVVVETANRTVQFCLCASLWVIVLYARMRGIPWHSRVADIITGFLISLTTRFVVFVTVEILHFTAATINLSRLSMVAYIVGLIFWQVAFLRKEVAFVEPSLERLQALEQYWQNLRKGFITYTHR
jgi:hypothetical protein